MPFNASGVFQRIHNWISDRDAGIEILADRHDAEDDNFASAINSIMQGLVSFLAPIKTPSGTAANPSYTFTGDTDTGIYRLAADGLGVSAGGQLVLELTQNQIEALSLVITGSEVTFDGNTVWHAGNQGPGSGLDADTVDGIQSNVIARKDQNNTFTQSVTVNGSVVTGSFIQAESAEQMPMRLYKDTAGGLTRMSLRNTSDGFIGEMRMNWDIGSYAAMEILTPFNTANGLALMYRIGRDGGHQWYRYFQNLAMVLDPSGRLGVGTTLPESKAHVSSGTLSKSWSAYGGTTLTLESTAANVLQMIGGSGHTSEIWFGDENSMNSGRLRYEHNGDKFEVFTAGGERFCVNSAGIEVPGRVKTDTIDSFGTQLTVSATQGLNVSGDRIVVDGGRVHHSDMDPDAIGNILFGAAPGVIPRAGVTVAGASLQVAGDGLPSGQTYYSLTGMWRSKGPTETLKSGGLAGWVRVS